MNRTQIVSLAVGLGVALLLLWTTFGAVGERIDNERTWCENHNGTYEAKGEVLYCDLPEKDVQSGDIHAAGYPENVSAVDGTNVSEIQTKPIGANLPVVIPVALTVALGVGGIRYLRHRE